MQVPPIIERELRVALRKLDVRKARMQASLVGAGFCLAFSIASALGGVWFVRKLQPWLFCAGVYYAVVRTLWLAAGLFVQERQEQTLGFLFLAGMSIGEIFVTKVLGALLVASSNLLALVPFMAIPFLSGGVSFSVFWASVWCLPNLLVLALALSTLTSVCCRDESASLTAAQLVGVLLSVTTPAVHWLGQSGGLRMSKAWLLLSPGYGPWMIFKGFSFGTLAEFWQNAAVTFLWSCVCFGLAAAILRFYWRRQNELATLSSLPSRLEQWFRGEASRRKRAGWLEKNPFVWLATYDRHPERLAWIVLGCTAVLWMAGWATLRKVWLTNAVFFLTATVVNISLDMIMMYAAAKRIGEDRRTGALELLLTTPLGPNEIVNGQLEALRSQFKPVCRTAALAWLGLAVVGLLLRQWNWRALIIYAVIWTALIAWVMKRSFRGSLGAFYAALITGRPTWAVWRASGWHSFTWFWLAYNARNLFSQVGFDFPSGSTGEFVFFLIGAPFAVLMYFVARHAQNQAPYSARNLAGNWLVQEFRMVAQSPIPALNDPRFKKWRVRQRFPIEQSK